MQKNLPLLNCLESKLEVAMETCIGQLTHGPLQVQIRESAKKFMLARNPAADLNSRLSKTNPLEEDRIPQDEVKTQVDVILNHPTAYSKLDLAAALLTVRIALLMDEIMPLISAHIKPLTSGFNNDTVDWAINMLMAHGILEYLDAELAKPEFLNKLKSLDGRGGFD